MRAFLHESLSVLERTPATLAAMLGGLGDSWTRSNYGPESFSPFDVVGHLIHGDRTDWIPRLRMILKHGESKPFEPFDRYAMYETSKGKSMQDLLGAFQQVRTECLRDLRALNLSNEQLTRTGRHPELGIVTAQQLIATWVVHDLGHVHQIAKAMAWQYKDEVGAWREYLTILPKARA